MSANIEPTAKPFSGTQRASSKATKALIRAQRDAQIIEARRTGKTGEEISAEFGVHTSTVYAICKRELQLHKAQMQADVSELVANELSLYAKIQEKIWPQCTAGDLKAIDRFMRISQARRELLGLDAPKRVIPVTPDGEPITPVLIYLPANGRELPGVSGRLIDGDEYAQALKDAQAQELAQSTDAEKALNGGG